MVQKKIGKTIKVSSKHLPEEPSISFESMRFSDVNGGFGIQLQHLMTSSDQINTSYNHAKVYLLNLVRQAVCSINIETKQIGLFGAILIRIIDTIDGFAFLNERFFVNADGFLILSIDGQTKLEQPNFLSNYLQNHILQNDEFSPPALDYKQKSELRSPYEISQRIVALTAMALRATETMPVASLELLSRFQAHAWVSPAERNFFYRHLPPPEERQKFANQLECVSVLLWALGDIEELPYPNSPCDIQHVLAILETWRWPQTAKRSLARSKDTILEQSDLIYTQYWTCISAKRKKVSPPGSLNSIIVQERHRAIYWLVRRLKIEWDELKMEMY